MATIVLATYDESFARDYWYLSTVSYCRNQRIRDWTCGKPCRNSPKPLDIKIFYNGTGDDSGFGAYNPEKDEIMLLFRGTLPWDIKNWF